MGSELGVTSTARYRSSLPSSTLDDTAEDDDDMDALVWIAVGVYNMKTQQ